MHHAHSEYSLLRIVYGFGLQLFLWLAVKAEWAQETIFNKKLSISRRFKNKCTKNVF